MKKNLICLATAGFLAAGAFAQNYGTTDQTFGTNGIFSGNTLESGLQDPNAAILVMPDKKIVAAGYSASLNKVYAVRLTANGSLDNTFGLGGYYFSDPTPGVEKVEDMIRMPDGRILIGGTSATFDGELNYTPFMLMLNASGSNNNSFGVSGVKMVNLTSPSSSTVSLQADANNSIYLCTRSADDHPFVIKYTSTGSPILNFQKEITGLHTNIGKISIQLLPNGNILVGGFDQYQIGLAMLNSQGNLNISFSGDGLLEMVSPAGGAAWSIMHLGITNHGNQPVIYGHSIFWDMFAYEYQYKSFLMRLNTNGTNDITFANNGVKTDFPYSDILDVYFMKAISYPGGRTLVSGRTSYLGNGYIYLAMVNSNGQLDTWFGSNGVRSISAGSSSESGKLLALQTNGPLSSPRYDILTCGYPSNVYSVFRLIGTDLNSAPPAPGGGDETLGEELPDASTATLQAFPNPCQGSFQLSGIDADAELTLRLFQTDGRCITVWNTPQTVYNLPGDLPDGLYILTAETGGKTITSRLVLTR